jgi:hypothetical protein
MNVAIDHLEESVHVVSSASEAISTSAPESPFVPLLLSNTGLDSWGIPIWVRNHETFDNQLTKPIHFRRITFTSEEMGKVDEVERSPASPTDALIRLLSEPSWIRQ